MRTRWLAWLLCGVMAVDGVTLFVACARADAPADEPRVRPRGKAVDRVTQVDEPRTPPKPPAAKKTAPKSSAKVSTKKPKRPARAPKAPDEQALDIATGPDLACHVQLRGDGVSFVKLAAERAPHVQLPIRLTGKVAGVEIRGAGKNKATHYLDCRLALALVRWAPQLLAAGVVGIDHYSIYRPDAQVSGTRQPSGHALAMAIDAGRFHMRDGRVLTVLDAWKDKTKGADPCKPRLQQSADEHMLRELVCNAAQRGIFQTIVTPHHNPEHDNHVHLEVSSTLAPTWIH